MGWLMLMSVVWRLELSAALSLAWLAGAEVDCAGCLGGVAPRVMVGALGVAVLLVAGALAALAAVVPASRSVALLVASHSPAVQMGLST